MRRRPKFLPRFSLSLLAHALVLAALLVVPGIYARKVIREKIYRVDLVPQTKEPVQKVRKTPPKPKKKKKPKPKKKKKKVVKKVVEKPKIEPKPKIKEKVLEKTEPEEKIRFMEPEEALKILSGTEAAPSEFPYPAYINEIKARLDSAWEKFKPSRTLSDAETLSAVVTFRIFRDGRTEFRGVTKSSGLKHIDLAARMALEDAQPFSSLPSGWKKPYVDWEHEFSVN